MFTHATRLSISRYHNGDGTIDHLDRLCSDRIGSEESERGHRRAGEGAVSGEIGIKQFVARPQPEIISCADMHGSADIQRGTWSEHDSCRIDQKEVGVGKTGL